LFKRVKLCSIRIITGLQAAMQPVTEGDELEYTPNNYGAVDGIAAREHAEPSTLMFEGIRNFACEV
jgi:hypothetical protein